MENRTVHMIGNAHIDPVWLWQWPEGCHEVIATFRSALDRMDEYPDFVFTSSSAAFYEWVEAIDPATFERIRARVADGRWRIVGGWWLQPDCNIPSGESFVRQGLYGQRYFREKFGVTARVGYNPDSFGHNAMLPQILKKSGMDAYVFMRPEPNETHLPGRLFWWESDDGSRVLAFRIIGAYCTSPRDLVEHVHRCAKEVQPCVDAVMCFYGVGNHGGGPTKANIEQILHFQQDPDAPDLPFSAPDLYFDRIRAESPEIPVWHDELQHHASGCYAAHSGIKRWNREAENALLAAEKFSAVASTVAGLPYPTDLGRAWRNVLFNQFHDIMGGTSLEEAYEDARNMHGEAMSIAGRAMNNAVQRLAWSVDVPEEAGTVPVFVFNPLPWPVTANVEFEMNERAIPDPPVARDETGTERPAQVIPSHASALYRARVTFTADLPALGYRLYRLAEGEPVEPAVTVTDNSLENDFLRLEIDPGTGYILRLFDKRTGVDVLDEGAARPVVIEDPSDTWSHQWRKFDDVIGEFRAASVQALETGPVRGVLRVVSTYGDSTVEQRFILCAGIPRVDVQVTVDWHEHFKALKLRFPTALREAKATYEIPYGTIERPCDGEEEPMQAWVDLTGTAENGEVFGLSILNDGKYSADVTGATMDLTALRSPIYAHHVPFRPNPEHPYTFIDQGVQHFTYSLLPHAGDWRDGGTVRRAAELNQRPFVLVGTWHGGPLPRSASYLSCEPENVVVSVVKRAEDGDAWIVRAYETAKRQTWAKLEMPLWGRTVEADFGPCEIKTFRVPDDEGAPVAEVNMLEDATDSTD